MQVGMPQGAWQHMGVFLGVPMLRRALLALGWGLWGARDAGHIAMPGASSRWRIALPSTWLLNVSHDIDVGDYLSSKLNSALHNKHQVYLQGFNIHWISQEYDYHVNGTWRRSYGISYLTPVIYSWKWDVLGEMLLETSFLSFPFLLFIFFPFFLNLILFYLVIFGCVGSSLLRAGFL